MRGLGAAAVGVVLGLCPATGLAGAAGLLYPADGHRAAGAEAWVVVEGPAPRVAANGVAVPLRELGGVHHGRLQGLGPKGTRVAVEAGGRRREVTVYGQAEAPSAFHRAVPGSCQGCHDAGPTGCTECHRWGESKHRPHLARGCVGCHPGDDRRPVEVAPLCTPCHPGYGKGKHPKLRHPLTSPRDPLRPSRGMDCASCHDPHAPRCLSCLGRGELRQWCKGCHAKGPG